MDHFSHSCFMFVMLSFLSIADLKSPAGNELTSWRALVCVVLLRAVTFPGVVLDQVWYLIVSIPDLYLFTHYLESVLWGIGKKCIPRPDGADC